MDPVDNPFRPGAGRRPPVLAGREPLIGAFDIVIRMAAERGEGDRGWILNGLRGVGKTVLLNEMLAQVRGSGWIAAKLEAGSTLSLPAALATALSKALRGATGRHPAAGLRRLLGVFRAFSIRFDPESAAMSLGIDVAPSRGTADSGRFGDDLYDLLEVLGETSRELGIGTLILIDELQEASKGDLAAVNAAVHHLGQAGVPLPVIFVGAGLPSLPAQLADATSYSERLFDYRPVGLLEPHAAETALVRPTLERGVGWQPDALSLALDTAGGYPYFLQAVGKHVWDATRASTITVDDVQFGCELARREIDGGLYRSRWERATLAQRELLRALAINGGGEAVAISDLATSLGRRRVSDLSVARTELIKKGLVYAPERGMLAFTVPGMHSFVLRMD